jgi:hypothetical protein
MCSRESPNEQRVWYRWNPVRRFLFPDWPYLFIVSKEIMDIYGSGLMSCPAPTRTKNALGVGCG